jgi:hypothetical protein
MGTAAAVWEAPLPEAELPLDREAEVEPEEDDRAEPDGALETGVVDIDVEATLADEVEPETRS